MGAIQNRWGRLCGDFCVFSVTSLISINADVVPFLAHFEPFLAPRYDGVVLLRPFVVPQVADTTDSVRVVRPIINFANADVPLRGGRYCHGTGCGGRVRQ
jgi:hypothetical protein